MEEQEQKRRDSAEHQLSARLYTAEALPPFPVVVEQLVYFCYRTNPETIRKLLPAGLSPDPNGSVIGVFFLHGLGWGIGQTTGGFFSPVIQEYRGTDTQDACFFLRGVADEAMSRLATRYYAPFRKGGSDFKVNGREISVVMTDDETGPMARMILTRHPEPPSLFAGNDRYLGLDGSGHLISMFIPNIGHGSLCDVISFEIPESAPADIQALRPVEFLFAMTSSSLILTWGVPERIWQAEADVAPGRAALLDIFDRQARAVLLVSATGHVLHANSRAARLLARVALGHADPLLPHAIAERLEMRGALAQACAGRLGARHHRFALPRRDGDWPLIAELAHADPALAGPGTAIVLLTDPMRSAVVDDPEVLQLLGLTPAEARIAAIVGAGLAPRDAALRLGLQENTVRSTLKLVFDKLGIGRQAELAQIVARLAQN